MIRPIAAVPVLGALSLLLLGACEMERPAGAFTPDGGREDDGFTDMKSDTAGDEPDDPEPDAASGDPDQPTPEGGTVQPSGPFAAVTGKYLVRMDNYSTAEAVQNGVTLQVKNRISNLYYVSIDEVDGQLVGHEKLCGQTYWNSCTKGCSRPDAWTVTLDTRVPKFFADYQIVDRKYNVDAQGNLTAELSAITLGFNPPDGETASVMTALPSSTSDARVWHLVAPTDDSVVGLRARIRATLLGPAGLQVALDCTVSGVQVYATSFQGQVDLASKSALSDKSFRLDTTGSSGASIAFSSGMYCTQENLDGTMPSDQVSVISFKSTTGVNCPPDFDSRFPGSTTPLVP
ncbi:MAG: hypothetical protein JWN48_455 [Myxococcaceae bacterium]|nr:hypothetical protein [Myxococcaceae bacterium]